MVLRVLVLAFFAYTAARQLRSHDFEVGILHGILFGVHELGHLVFAFGGEIIGALGGSLSQVLLPLGAAALMAARKDRFGVAVCGCLLAYSMGQVAVYIADARAESLDLVSFSSEAQVHDWNFILERWRMLKHDVAIARGVRTVAWLILGGSVVLALVELRRLWRGTPSTASA
jgi:hypothetical protein